jgi:hypothetical protein
MSRKITHYKHLKQAMLSFVAEVEMPEKFADGTTGVQSADNADEVKKGLGSVDRAKVQANPSKTNYVQVVEI